jgi:hypothetical protein
MLLIQGNDVIEHLAASTAHPALTGSEHSREWP